MRSWLLVEERGVVATDTGALSWLENARGRDNIRLPQNNLDGKLILLKDGLLLSHTRTNAAPRSALPNLSTVFKNIEEGTPEVKIVIEATTLPARAAVPVNTMSSEHAK